ncbi:hypothetical protein NDU88_011398 [Pleurodeles waltl]|uniref:Secreted protein n=1 Tax=Pleurodeles waltl TaxID=8319 RepID=A0AAV7S4R6_PLEWA|nr:hypothetical protein NDU88_011398 [Pleurodeles waltl]
MRLSPGQARSFFACLGWQAYVLCVACGSQNPHGGRRSPSAKMARSTVEALGLQRSPPISSGRGRGERAPAGTRLPLLRAPLRDCPLIARLCPPGRGCKRASCHRGLPLSPPAYTGAARSPRSRCCSRGQGVPPS